MTFTLPRTIEQEILPFVHEKPTSKEEIICALKERAWEKKNIKTVLNYLFGVPIQSFIKGSDNRVYIDRFSI